MGWKLNCWQALTIAMGMIRRLSERAFFFALGNLVYQHSVVFLVFGVGMGIYVLAEQVVHTLGRKFGVGYDTGVCVCVCVCI